MYGFTILCGISKGTLKFHTNFEPIHRKVCILLSCIFACELRYLWIVTSYALVRRASAGVSGVLQRSQSVYPTELVAAHPDSASDHLSYWLHAPIHLKCYLWGQSQENLLAVKPSCWRNAVPWDILLPSWYHTLSWKCCPQNDSGVIFRTSLFKPYSIHVCVWFCIIAKMSS